ncbi:hypothetical protein CLLU_10430 [Clostridium luticellarii]|uniref:Uncharacterized protein n=1 Tax=Clostridium luticellarii TaxID=1691940 RepID=A0A2T0BQ99_9CLOT|nr:hypothetical protein CLLU_10430 [Clostridium luticellarii]
MVILLIILIIIALISLYVGWRDLQSIVIIRHHVINLMKMMYTEEELMKQSKLTYEEILKIDSKQNS